MATWSSQVGPVFAGAVAVAWRGAVGAFACGAWAPWRSRRTLGVAAPSLRCLLLQRHMASCAGIEPRVATSCTASRVQRTLGLYALRV